MNFIKYKENNVKYNEFDISVFKTYFSEIYLHSSNNLILFFSRCGIGKYNDCIITQNNLTAGCKYYNFSLFE